MQRELINPITKTDYPDPDVIRVGDTYYMLSTTMHFMPGGAILKSYDLVHWELNGYLYDTLTNTPAQRLEQEFTDYGHGMWAPSFRYHNGVFYVAFVAPNSNKTYLFTSKDINGPWEKSMIDGYYHDCSLLFDDDGRVYVVYGNTEIWLTELKEDLSGPKENGLHKCIIKEQDDVILGYEGAHFYKINGKYYIFLVHWPKSTMRRTESCFVADSLEDEFVGKDIFDDDRGLAGQGVAQGGIVDTPSGKWYAILFQDSGAVGRIPILVPMKWENDFPVLGSNGKLPKYFDYASSRPQYRYEELYTSDDFKYPREEGEHPKLKLQWQWNHMPNAECWRILPEGGLAITTNKLCINMTHAVNTLTQRMMWPGCEGTVEVDASGLNEGDIAGLCALQGNYGFLGIQKDAGNYYLVQVIRENDNQTPADRRADFMPGTMVEKIRLQESKATICLKASFEDMQDKLEFFYQKKDRFVRVGANHKLQFKLDHFCGARFGLFVYSTREVGGEAIFRKFKYDVN